ncbi:hypothetical protein Tco_1564109 [Tanacetum coccineum]
MVRLEKPHDTHVREFGGGGPGEVAWYGGGGDVGDGSGDDDDGGVGGSLVVDDRRIVWSGERVEHVDGGYSERSGVVKKNFLTRPGKTQTRQKSVSGVRGDGRRLGSAAGERWDRWKGGRSLVSDICNVRLLKRTEAYGCKYPTLHAVLGLSSTLSLPY